MFLLWFALSVTEFVEYRSHSAATRLIEIRNEAVPPGRPDPPKRRLLRQDNHPAGEDQRAVVLVNDRGQSEAHGPRNGLSNDAFESESRLLSPVRPEPDGQPSQANATASHSISYVWS